MERRAPGRAVAGATSVPEACDLSEQFPRMGLNLTPDAMSIPNFVQRMSGADEMPGAARAPASCEIALQVLVEVERVVRFELRLSGARFACEPFKFFTRRRGEGGGGEQVAMAA